MHRLAALCRKEWLLLARDPHGLLVLFVVPTVFILIMSLALRDAFSVDRQTHLALHVDNQDGGALSLQLQQALADSDTFALVEHAAAGPQLRLILLPGFSELLATRFEFAGDYLAGEAEPELLRIEYAATLLPQVRLGARLTVQQLVQAVQNDYLLVSVLGYAQDKADALRYVNDPRRLPLTESLIGLDRAARPPSAVQQSVPAWLIFALFFSVIPLSTSFVIERLEGSLLRLRVLDVPAGLVLGAKALAFYAVNLLQMLAMLLVGSFLVPLFGGEALQVPAAPFALWLIGSATSVAALGLALLIAVSVRTTTQATIAGGASTLLLAALGGIMVPKLVMPPAMQAAAAVSPMSWALEGYWDLLLRGGGWRELLPECLALLMFGGAAMFAATILFRRVAQG